jgi:hypothetical protein
MDQNQTRTWSVSWYAKAMYQISNEYLKAWTKKVRKTDLPDRQMDGRTECKPKVPSDFVGRGLVNTQQLAGHGKPDWTTVKYCYLKLNGTKQRQKEKKNVHAYRMLLPKLYAIGAN